MASEFPFTCPLILVAIPEEENALTQALGGAGAFEPTLLNARLGITISQPTNPKHRFLLARSGVGPVNAALATAWIAEACPRIDAVILLGVGGALAPELKIGELVIAQNVLQHDSFSSLDFGHPRMAPGHFVLNEETAAAHVAEIPTDAKLVRWLEQTQIGAHSGTLLSGSEFVGTFERKRALAALHKKALLVDMEAAGVAQISARLGLPFVTAKTVADRLQPDGSIESDFRACVDGAERNAARVLQNLVKPAAP